MSGLRIAYAGDRDIAVWVLDEILRFGVQPLALLVPEESRQSHAAELFTRCSYLPSSQILRGTQFRSAPGMSMLRKLELDYIVCVHFPYVFPAAALAVAQSGVLNLHPSFLPYNRGWHTPSWSILDGTPAGATLHFMSEHLDSGDIVHQQQIEVSPGATADTLYAQLKALELEVFREAWPSIVSGQYQRRRQVVGSGTAHRRSDLCSPDVQHISLDSMVRAGDLLRQLRALTTNSVDEAAYYEVLGRRYRVRVNISLDVSNPDSMSS